MKGGRYVISTRVSGTHRRLRADTVLPFTNFHVRFTKEVAEATLIYARDGGIDGCLCDGFRVGW